MKITTAFAVLLLVAASLAAQTGVLQPQAPQAAASSDAPIGPRDVLDIRVFQDATMNTKTTVTDDGKISFAVVGKLDVSGLTPTQLEQKIKAELEKKYLQ